MGVTPAPLTLPRVRGEWPLTSPPKKPRDDGEIARQFETIIAEALLRSARAAELGDDSFGASPGAENTRAMIDHARAEAIARAAPMGVARLLAAEASPRLLAAEASPRLLAAER